MEKLSEILVRLKALVLRERADADLDEELRYHLDREIERNVANGMSATDAHFAARRAFGNVSVATESARDAWRWRRLEELRQDVVFAGRTFRRAPAFALTVVATIGLGLGLLTTAFTVFNAYVLRPLAVREPYSLYDLFTRAENGVGHNFTWRQAAALRARRDLVDDAYAYTFHATRLRGSAALGQLVGGNYFQMLGVPPALGRTLIEDDAQPPRGNDVIVLSHRTWQSVFGGDSNVVGTRINLRGVSLTIVGVAREGFGGLGSVPNDFWAPITVSRALGAADPFAASQPEVLRIVVRTRPNHTVEQSTKALETWMREVTRDRAQADRLTSAFLMPRGTSLPATAEVYALFAPIVLGFLFVLLIACANVANMMLARGVARQREIGIRLALGAGRARLVRQLLTESILLSIPAAAAGFLVSRLAVGASLRVMFATVPAAYTDHLRVIPLDADVTMVLFMFGAAAVAAIAFGLAPALQATRPNIVQASRGDFDSEMRPSRMRNALVVAQITFSALLLISAGVLLAGARDAQRLDPGIQTRDVLQIGTAEEVRSRVIDALHRDVSVRDVASARSAPLDGGWWVIDLRTAQNVSAGTNANFVSSEYFGTVGLPLVSGRSFTSDEAASRAPVVLVSAAAAQRFWPGRSAIGETLSLTTNGGDSAILGPFRRATVIGVVGNAVPGSVARERTWPTVYYPQPLAARGASILIRTRGDADPARAEITSTLARVDSSAVEDVHSLASSLAVQVYPFRAAYWLASAIGYIALLLTLTGVYGVLAFIVSQRRKEFGIRMALGAGASTLIALVLRQSLRLSLIGVAAGAVIALAISKLMSGLVFIVRVFDVAGYVSGSLVVLATCLIAAYVPSRRAASANPVEALRADS